MNPFAKFEKSKADKEPKSMKEGSKKEKFLDMIQSKKSGKRKFSAGGYADGGMPTQGMMPQRPPVMPLQAQATPSMPMQSQGMQMAAPQQAFKAGGPVRRGYGKARGA